MKAALAKIKPLTTSEIISIDVPKLIGFLTKSKDNRSQFLAAFLMWSISSQVRGIRLSRGWTIAKLASKAGVHPATIYRLENSKTCLFTTCNTLLKIAHAFNCALVVRFAAYSDIIQYICDLRGPDALKQFLPGDSDEILEQIALERWAKEE